MFMYDLVELLVSKGVITKEEIQKFEKQRESAGTKVPPTVLEGSITSASIADSAFTGSKFKDL
jgi:hypothetical protein